MLGRDDESMSLLERAHHAHLEAGETHRSVRCALWVCMHHASRGELGPAGGWLARAERLLGDEDCAERGYLLIPAAFGAEAAGDFETAAATAASAAEIGQRFGDADLYALAAHMNGQFVIQEGRVDEGFRLLDEAMVTATSGSVSPIVTGLVYCGVILACVEVLDVRRASRVDGGARPLVRRPARARRVHRPLPRAPGGAHAAARRLARRPRGGAAGGRAARAGVQPRRSSAGLLPAGRGAPALGEARRGRGGLRRVAPLRVGAAARPGAPSTRARAAGAAAAAAIRRVLGETTSGLAARCSSPHRSRSPSRWTSSRRRATPPAS